MRALDLQTGGPGSCEPPDVVLGRKFQLSARAGSTLKPREVGGPLRFHMNLRMAFSTSTKVAIEFLSETPPNLWVLSCSAVIWRTLCFPVCECGTSSYSFSFFQECLFQFSVCKLCISDYVYSRVLIIFSAFVNGIIFLIPSADCSVFCAQTQLNVIALALSPWFVLFVCFL